MKEILLITLLFLTNVNNGISQRIIKSATIKLNIPAKIKDTLSSPNPVQVDSIIESSIDFDDFVQTLEAEKDSINIDLKIDTTIYNSRKQLKIKLLFLPEKVLKTGSMEFPPGEYLLDSAKAFMLYTYQIKKVIENNILNFLDTSDRVIIKIFGTADAISIKKIKYRNEFGKQIKSKCFFEGTENEIEINNKLNITNNKQLAFLRTYGIRHFLVKSIPELESLNVTFEHYIEIYKNAGSNFRTLRIEMIFVKLISRDNE